MAVDPNFTAANVIEAHQQIDQRRFPRAGGADDTDRLAALHGKGDVLQFVFAVAIGKKDAAEFDLRYAGHGCIS